MSKAILRLLILSLAVVPLAILYSSCGGGAPSSVSRDITGTGFTTVSLGNDVTVRVPAGALPDGATVNVVKASGKDAAPGEMEGGKSVGSAFKIDVGDQKLSKPITIEIAFDPKSLPKDTPEEAVFLAYYDEETQQWVPVGGQVDVDRNVIYIQTDHLSWWNPFSWNWEAWIAVMKKGLSVKLTDWVEGFQLLTTECEKSGQAVTVDESKANNVIQGCVTKDDASKPELRVVNLKSFYLGISPAPGGPGYPEATLLGPGDAASFTANTSDKPPAVVNADFTEAAMWRFVVGLVVRMLPDGEVIPNDGLAFIADGLKSTMSAKEASEKLDAGDSQGAAESIYELISGHSFVEAFAKLATEYGQKNGVDMMTKWTEAGVGQVLAGVAAVDVIVSATDFLANYVLNNHSAVAFTWAVSTPTVPPPTIPNVANGGVFDEAAGFAMQLCLSEFQPYGFVDVGGGVLQGHTDLMIFPDDYGTPYPAEDAQVRDMRVTAVRPVPISETDRLNGIDWQGGVLMVFRERTRGLGAEWGLWVDRSPVVIIRKISGQWQRDPPEHIIADCWP